MPQLSDAVKEIKVDSLAGLPEAAVTFIAFLEENPSVSIVLFEGEMGAGKTTFIKAICAGLGVQEAVSSPTYSIVNEYEGSDGRRIYHFDFYRIKDEQEALDIGLYEYLDSGNLCLIEWPSRIEKLLPEHCLLVGITPGEGEKRIITLKQT